MSIRSLAVIILAYSAMANAEPPAAAPSAEAPEHSLDSALAAAKSALDACQVRGFAVSVSVVDAAGVLKTLLAADGASSRGVQSSTDKAVTALTFKTSTSDLNQRILTDKGLAEVVAANPNYNTHPGGLLIMNESRIVGAIGVGGARPSEIDEACAAAGLERLRIKPRHTPK
jgi:uncharacterized protein GlcG (DUF336 family)